MTRLTDLTPTQIQLMIRLDDGYPHDDSVDARLTSLPDPLKLEVLCLREMKLVELHRGWGGELWARLTSAWRQVRDEGQSR